MQTFARFALAFPLEMYIIHYYKSLDGGYSMYFTDDLYLFCPILGKDIAYGYCWELRNIPGDDVLMDDDKVEDWDEAERMCDTCEHFRHQK